MKRRKPQAPAEHQPAQQLPVRFARHHRHAGKDYQPGDEATVTKVAFEKLANLDVVEPPPGATD